MGPKDARIKILEILNRSEVYLGHKFRIYKILTDVRMTHHHILEKR